MAYDDAIREGHFVKARDDKGNVRRVCVHERDDAIILDGQYESAIMTPWQARYLAAKLYRLSRRIRARSEGSPKEQSDG
jgi:hypothetical protein